MSCFKDALCGDFSIEHRVARAPVNWIMVLDVYVKETSPSGAWGTCDTLLVQDFLSSINPWLAKMIRIQFPHTSKLLIFISRVACDPVIHASYSSTLLARKLNCKATGGVSFSWNWLPRLHYHKHLQPHRINLDAHLHQAKSSRLIHLKRNTSLVYNLQLHVTQMIYYSLVFDGFWVT